MQLIQKQFLQNQNKVYYVLILKTIVGKNVEKKTCVVTRAAKIENNYV